MFHQATKKKQKARVALIGPGGSGKTYTALTIAKHLGGTIALIDTERGSASKYAGDVADFQVVELPKFSPANYIQAINAAASIKASVLIIDSLSHAWEGESGILDQVDQRGGKFEAWKDMAPQTRKLIEAILTYPGHVIATLRTKTEYVIEDRESKGRMVKVPRKVGLAPKFKEGLEYEFDVVGNMDDGVLTVSKSRCSALHDVTIKHPGEDFAGALRTWLDDGAERAPVSASPAPLPREEARAALVRPAVDGEASAAPPGVFLGDLTDAPDSGMRGEQTKSAIRHCKTPEALERWLTHRAPHISKAYGGAVREHVETVIAKMSKMVVHADGTQGVDVNIMLDAAGLMGKKSIATVIDTTAQRLQDNLEAGEDAIRDEQEGNGPH